MNVEVDVTTESSSAPPTAASLASASSGAVTSARWEKVEAALAAATYHGQKEGRTTADGKRWSKAVTPGAVLLVAQGGEIKFLGAAGARSIVPSETELRVNTVYDVASLTKALVTTTLIMRLIDSGKVELDRRLSRIFQTFGTFGKERITVRNLLAHCSGLPAYVPFYKQIAKADSGEKAGIMRCRGALEMVYHDIYRLPLEHEPGTISKYSDVGFILLGHLIEVGSGGRHLDKVAAEQLFAPLKLRSTGFVELSRITRRGVAPITDVIAPTSECPWRRKLVWGEVQDENAWAMGGVAGHAGLFSTAEDVHAIARELINCYHGRGSLVSKDVARLFWTKDGTVEDSTWALGWDTPSPEGSSSGHHFGANAVGHLGYTGCSLWIDPERELEIILLTNRVHPSVDNNLIKEFRPQIHDLVMETLGYGG